MKKPKTVAFVLVPALAALIVWRVVSARQFAYIGTIEATEVDLSPRIASLVSEVPVREGDHVERDQPVVRLAAEDIKITADTAASDYERGWRLFKTGSIPAETYEHLKSARDESALRLEWATVKSPLRGRVLTRYIEPGEWVNPGTKLLTLADLEQVWAMFYVEEPILSKLSLGMKVRGVVHEMGDRSFDGKIIRLGNEAEFTPKNVQTREERTRLVYGIKVEFPNSDEALKPGMSIESKILEQRK